MLKKILFLLTLTLCTFATLHLVKGAITNSSRVIPYQGRLTDSGGNNVADGTYSMTFKIYTVSSGGSSSFTEAHSSVSVSSGLFSVLLGSLSASGVNLDFANPPYYLGITIGANAEMSPRIQMGFAALSTNSQYLDGTPLSSFVLNTAAIAGAVGTNTRLQATGTGTGSTGNGSIYFLNSSGTTAGRFDSTATTSATGGTITYDGGYTVHTFTTSGSFTPTGSINVEYLVVAGGGGGGSGNYGGGGGGAGGMLTGTGYSVTAQAYTVTVGGGGTGASSYSTKGNNGNNSVFATITATGGGGGGGGTGGSIGNNGGSGGGGQASGYSGGTGIGGQGYAGGNGAGGGSFSGGGGGGASQVGSNGSGCTVGGNGGQGLSSSISGTAVIYSSGGGGNNECAGTPGTGGTGAGNGGAQSGAGTNATGYGSGGGGGGSTQPQGNGYQGIVIIRYLTPTYGTLYLGSTNTSSADLAEYYVTGDKTLSAGDVVTITQSSLLNAQGKGVLQKANKPYDSKLVGVISTNPGVVLGSIDGDTGKADKRQLALAGRVPVKIDPDSEPIEVGDFLTSSDKRGYAKKATESGYVIGKALESWQPKSEYRNPKLETNTNDQNSNDRIEVFINLIYKQEKSEIEEMKRLICLDHPAADLCKKK